MRETWKVVGRDARYEVSDRGRVRNRKTRRVRKPYLSNDCEMLATFVPGERAKRRCFSVRLIMAEAFLGPRPPDHALCYEHGRVNHVDNICYRPRNFRARYFNEIAFMLDRYADALLRGESVDLIGKVVERYGLKLASGRMHPRAFILVNEIRKAFYRRHGLPLRRRRNPRGVSVERKRIARRQHPGSKRWTKLTEKIVRTMRALHREGVSCAELGRRYGVSRQCAHQALAENTWRSTTKDRRADGGGLGHEAGS